MRSAFFLRGMAGNLFCIGALHGQGRNQRRKILIVPPFAEELNKSRHILAAFAVALAEAGHDVLLPDLYGTGDSEGDFGEATLEIWRADLDVAIRHLDPETGLELIGLRAGALLAADMVSRYEVKSLTFLHPLVDGKQQLNQMLRLRLAAGLTGSGEKETAAQLRQRLAQGDSLEIAGYTLSSQLATDLESLALKNNPPTGAGRIDWIELVAESGRSLMPVSQNIIQTWEGMGITVSTAVVVCDQFWATQEIARCPELVHEAMKRFSR